MMGSGRQYWTTMDHWAGNDRAWIWIWILSLCVGVAVSVESDPSEVHTVEQCYGKTMSLVCGATATVRVITARYSQSERCSSDGEFSNFCGKEEPGNPACVGNSSCTFTTPWVYLSPECGYSNSFHITYQCIPRGLQWDICSVTSLESLHGFITSPNYPATYPPSLSCDVTISAPPGYRLNVYLLDLYLAYYKFHLVKRCIDRVWVSDGYEKTNYMCTGQQRGLVFTSEGESATLSFVSDDHAFRNAKGFWLYYEAFLPGDEGSTSPTPDLSHLSMGPHGLHISPANHNTPSAATPLGSSAPTQPGGSTVTLPPHEQITRSFRPREGYYFSPGDKFISVSDISKVHNTSIAGNKSDDGMTEKADILVKAENLVEEVKSSVSTARVYHPGKYATEKESNMRYTQKYSTRKEEPVSYGTKKPIGKELENIYRPRFAGSSEDVEPTGELYTAEDSQLAKSSGTEPKYRVTENPGKVTKQGQGHPRGPSIPHRDVYRRRVTGLGVMGEAEALVGTATPWYLKYTPSATTTQRGTTQPPYQLPQSSTQRRQNATMNSTTVPSTTTTEQTTEAPTTPQLTTTVPTRHENHEPPKVSKSWYPSTHTKDSFISESIRIIDPANLPKNIQELFNSIGRRTTPATTTPPATIAVPMMKYVAHMDHVKNNHTITFTHRLPTYNTTYQDNPGDSWTPGSPISASSPKVARNGSDSPPKVARNASAPAVLAVSHGMPHSLSGHAPRERTILSLWEIGAIAGGAAGMVLMIISVSIAMVFVRRKRIRRLYKQGSAVVRRPYKEVILAYGSSPPSTPGGLHNLGFDSESPVTSVEDVSNQGEALVGSVRSWRGLRPIDEAIEDLYTEVKQCSGRIPVLSRRPGPWMKGKSKSLDDLLVKSRLAGRGRPAEMASLSLSLESFTSGMNYEDYHGDGGYPDGYRDDADYERAYYHSLGSLYSDLALSRAAGNPPGVPERRRHGDDDITVIPITPLSSYSPFLKGAPQRHARNHSTASCDVKLISRDNDVAL